MTEPEIRALIAEYLAAHNFLAAEAMAAQLPPISGDIAMIEPPDSV